MPASDTDIALEQDLSGDAVGALADAAWPTLKLAGFTRERADRLAARYLRERDARASGVDDFVDWLVERGASSWSLAAPE